MYKNQIHDAAAERTHGKEYTRTPKIYFKGRTINSTSHWYSVNDSRVPVILNGSHQKRK